MILWFLISILTNAADTAPVPGGSYQPLLGKKKQVEVASFEIDVRAVTNGEYLAFVKSQRQWSKANVKPIFADSGYLRHWTSEFEFSPDIEKSPVTNVSWFAAKAYCAARGAELPNTDQWEYLAQFGPEDSKRDNKSIILEWYSKPNAEKLPNVKSTFKNKFGIWDVHGLIWEWTSDFNTTFVTGESRGDSALEKSLYCGAGSEGAADPNDYASFMRFGFRSSLQATYTTANLGFRCVKSKSSVRSEKTLAGIDAKSIYNVSSFWTDHNGKVHQLAEFRGSPVIISMVYLSCPYMCPMIVSDILGIEKKMKPELREKVRFILVSIDPGRDKPALMRDFMKKRSLDPKRWTILTSENDAEIRELASLLNFKYQKLENGEFTHSFLITGLDTEGRIGASLAGSGKDPADLLKVLSAK